MSKLDSFYINPDNNNFITPDDKYKLGEVYHPWYTPKGYGKETGEGDGYGIVDNCGYEDGYSHIHIEIDGVNVDIDGENISGDIPLEYIKNDN